MTFHEATEALVEYIVHTYKVSISIAKNMLDLASLGILGKQFDSSMQQKEVEALKKALKGDGPE
jgi:hypothetical protein